MINSDYRHRTTLRLRGTNESKLGEDNPCYTTVSERLALCVLQTDCVLRLVCTQDWEAFAEKNVTSTIVVMVTEVAK